MRLQQVPKRTSSLSWRSTSFSKKMELDLQRLSLLPPNICFCNPGTAQVQTSGRLDWAECSSVQALYILVGGLPSILTRTSTWYTTDCANRVHDITDTIRCTHLVRCTSTQWCPAVCMCIHGSAPTGFFGITYSIKDNAK
jgi:hypothetical protein